MVYDIFKVFYMTVYISVSLSELYTGRDIERNEEDMNEVRLKVRKIWNYLFYGDVVF